MHSAYAEARGKLPWMTSKQAERRGTKEEEIKIRGNVVSAEQTNPMLVFWGVCLMRAVMR